MNKAPPTASGIKHLPQFVGYREVQQSLGVSRRTVERMVRDSEFPRPVQLAPNRVGWQVESLTTWLEERSRGLLSRAVQRPDDLAPEQLAEAAVDLLTRAVEHEVGEPIDPRGLRVTYAPPSPEVTEEQLAGAEAREVDLLHQRFAGLDITRSTIMAAWLFPELREVFAAWTADPRASRAFLDPHKLRALALQALSDDAWAAAEAELGQVPARRTN